MPPTLPWSLDHVRLPAGLSVSSRPIDEVDTGGAVVWSMGVDGASGIRVLADAATGMFAHPAIGIPIEVDVFGDAPGVGVGGCAFTQFGLPVWSGPGLEMDFEPASNLRSPAAMQPVWIRAAEHDWWLLAPRARWHDQIITIVEGPEGRRLRWGPHGDLREVPEGWAIELEIRRGPSLRRLLRSWGDGVRRRAGTLEVDRRADVATSHLSYWTDNGAAYWYRNEPGRDLAQTVVDVVADLRERRVPIRAVELDSWFYDHEIARAVRPDDYPDEVPPTPMLRWDARADTVPDGMPAFADALGRPPLILHSRHLSPEADGADATWWFDRCAMPSDPDWFRGWFERARAWGASTIEQDWMLLYWFGVRQLREGSGRAAHWLDTLDRLAAEHDLHLWFCMATPSDLIHAATLRRVSAVRTSDDYRFAEDPASLWRWFLTVNLLADGLGLPPFKDCFFSSGVDDLADPGPTDGDPHHELESVLSALSAGPVGIGDRVGRTDAAIVARCCRADGAIIGPDRPVAILGRSMDPTVAITWAATTTGPQVHLLAIQTGPVDDGAPDAACWTDSIDLGALFAELGLSGPAGTWLGYDMRAGTADVLGPSVEVSLGPRAWRHLLLVPVVDGVARIGDVDRHVPLGHRRYDHADGPTLIGAPGERVDETWWTIGDGLRVTTHVVDADGLARPVSAG